MSADPIDLRPTSGHPTPTSAPSDAPSPATTIPNTTPKLIPSLRDPSPTDHAGDDTQTSPVGGQLRDHDQSADDTHSRAVVVAPPQPDQLYDETHVRPVGLHLLPTDQVRPDTQTGSVGGGPSLNPPVHDPDDTHVATDGWVELRVWAEMLNDQQEHRKAIRNKTCADWKEPRPGIFPEVYAAILDEVAHVEHQMALCLRRSYRKVVPAEIIAWQKAQKGVGEHLLARLLGHLGDPYIATPHWWEGTGANRTLMVGEPYARTVAQLWQYCGHGDPTRRHKVKGQTAEQLAAAGSPTCKMLVHLLAEACMKQQPGNTYRDVYDKARENAEGRLHSVECVRCGPSGKPAQPGDPWSKAHQHAHALRLVGKEILRDLWLAAREANR